MNKQRAPSGSREHGRNSCGCVQTNTPVLSTLSPVYQEDTIEKVVEKGEIDHVIFFNFPFPSDCSLSVSRFEQNEENNNSHCFRIKGLFTFLYLFQYFNEPFIGSFTSLADPV